MQGMVDNDKVTITSFGRRSAMLLILVAVLVPALVAALRILASASQGAPSVGKGLYPEGCETSLTRSDAGSWVTRCATAENVSEQVKVTPTLGGRYSFTDPSGNDLPRELPDSIYHVYAATETKDAAARLSMSGLTKSLDPSSKLTPTPRPLPDGSFVVLFTTSGKDDPLKKALVFDGSTLNGDSVR